MQDISIFQNIKSLTTEKKKKKNNKKENDDIYFPLGIPLIAKNIRGSNLSV